jgi:hypothetical protein
MTNNPYNVVNVKMAEDTDQGVDCSLEDIVNAVSQIKHIKSRLKKMILESVSTPSNKIHALQKDRADISAKNIELQTEVEEAKQEIQGYKNARSTISVARSIERTKKPEASMSDAQRQPITPDSYDLITDSNSPQRRRKCP